MVRVELQTRDGARAVDLPVRRLFIAGYTGRDQAAVAAHVKELAEHGIPAPSRVPSLFPGVPARVTTASTIAVVGGRTSGEAEFVATRHDGRLLVGVGSDHTDRQLEAHSVVMSKQVCEKPVGARWWPADELEDHWDELRLVATAWDHDRPVPYQEGALAQMLPLEALVAEVEARVGPLEGDVVFSGTLPLLAGEFVCGPRFRAELVDPVLGRSLVCEYEVQALSVFDD